MLIDGRTIPSGTRLTTDVCIVGAGAAGIALALTLCEGPYQITVLESGGLEPDPETQRLAEGAVTGLPYYPLQSARLRCFGGSTTHWGGWCRPLEAIDFEERPWVPHSGWPITRATLDPHYLRAQELCQLGHFDYDPSGWDLTAAPVLPLQGDAVRTKLIQFSPPTRFGARYREALSGASNVKLCLNSNVVGLASMANGRGVANLDVTTFARNSFQVAAKLYILAAGGIDNPRLLLVSNRANPRGLGNDHDLVGRFFADHIMLDSAGVFPIDPKVSFDLYQPQSRTVARKSKHALARSANVMGYLTLTPELQQRGATLNYSCNVLRTSWADYYLHADRAATTNDSTLREIGEAIRNVWRNLTDASKGALGLGDSDIFYKIVTTQEQAPNPDSRVSLAETRDAFGVPLASLHWQLTDLDRHTIKVALGAIAQAFGASNMARIQIPHDFTVEPWPSYMVGSWHHCGTTRMHRDPKQGVVDADCKVHGMDNLYVAGSSVFPTGGNGNPTLTIIALALRLAEHVRRVLK